jgi:glycosyltransferase involved in cell wall biosynthesis
LFDFAESNRPLLALVMIVKDEAHTIAQTLMSIKALVDRYYILDTGSTDGTPQVIEQVMDGVPGKVFHV